MADIKIGVINWDGCLESGSTYFGSYCAKSLSNPKYKDRVPFYADVDKDGAVSFHKRTQDEFDCEMEYAIKAGTDYFAYVWYTEKSKFDDNENVSETARHVHELTYIRKLHMSSSLNTKLKMCAILSAHPITDEELYDLALTMQKPYYQYIDGKPLVYIYTGYDKNLITRLESACKNVGTKEPYAVIFTNNNPAEKCETYEIADAVSAYCIPTEDCDCETYGDFAEEMLRLNSLMLTYNLPAIPMFSVGWNPAPRIDSPVPWYSYANKIYAPIHNPAQFEDGATRLGEWMKDNGIEPSTILSYAWNEFEEGGYICPTLRRDGSVDESRVKAFRKAIEILKK